MKDFHSSPYDSGTKLKLEILGDYLTEWLPVFLHSSHIKRINIYDLFCGPGKDSSGNLGSPSIIFNSIDKYSESIKDKVISIWLNDLDSGKIETCKEIESPKFVEVRFSSKTYEECFKLFGTSASSSAEAHFFYLDPTGLVDYKRFFDLILSLKNTDFLMFIPSESIRRFSQEPGFSSHLPGFPTGLKQEEVVKTFCEYCSKNFIKKEKVEEEKEDIYLAPFSIKKQKSPSVQGLVFGSKSLLGLEKYIRLVWKKSNNGEANFDLIGMSLFPQGNAFFLKSF